VGLVSAWTGRTACALQAALRLSNELFAQRLDIAPRTVAAWHQKPELRPNSEMQHRLDNALERAPVSVKTRFAELIDVSSSAPESPPAEQDPAAADAEQRLVTDPNATSILEWLDRCSGWAPGTSRRKVATRLAQLGWPELQDRGLRRGRVDQRRMVESLTAYYGDDGLPDYGTYGARYGDGGDAATSILTRADWLDLDCLLVPENDRLDLVSGVVDSDGTFDDLSADMAVQRLAEMMVLGFRLVDTPLYWLQGIEIHKGAVGGALGLIPFVRYALTMDLLESELVDAIADGHSPAPGSLPLRDRLMPTQASVINVSDRLCSGGALALCAIARPASGRRPSDYVLLVQERSGRVLNAARRLAVIPKGFHEPLVDYRADAQIRLTLIREMEEELFGRDDVDSTAVDLRATDPLHPSRLSDPMRWLTANDGRLRIECTGFGLNLVSGNCEFAGLIVIDDEEFWSQYGGHISANWESGSLRQYSSLDRELITELIGDVAWSNEGLFALLQGLRRLTEIGGDRVDLPTIEWEIR
jgi:hypothetical protein